jgi:hypothetical protein
MRPSRAGAFDGAAPRRSRRQSQRTVVAVDAWVAPAARGIGREGPLFDGYV